VSLGQDAGQQTKCDHRGIPLAVNNYVPDVKLIFTVTLTVWPGLTVTGGGSPLFSSKFLEVNRDGGSGKCGRAGERDAARRASHREAHRADVARRVLGAGLRILRILLGSVGRIDSD
jgi:hypothetical protein